MRQKPKILIVDDNLLNILIFEKILRDLNVDFVRALNGNEAIEKCKENEFALALVDVHMPNKDGYETTKEIRTQENHKFLPIIFFSAVYNENYYAVKGLETGGVDFMTKPVIPEILEGKVKVFLELHEQKCIKQELIERLEKTNKALLDEIAYRETVEKNLIEAKEKAEESEKLKTAFLANMSHEIRTPMNAIIGFTDLLLDNELTEEKRKEFVGIIKSSSNSLLNIINDIMDIAKLEAGHIQVKNQPFDINDLLIKLCSYYEIEKTKTKKQHIEIKTNPTKDKNEKLIVHTDGNRLRQIFDNLISNSLKFTKEGYIEIGYEIKDHQIIFHVKDTGIGIPKDKIGIVFQRFIQVDQSSTRNYGGTGLGLAISRNLARLLGGDMWVESEEGKYTTFYFSHPYIQSDQPEIKEIKTPQKKQQFDWSSKTFLVVEDIASNYKFIEAALKKTNANLIWAKDGVEAIELVQSKKEIDLVLLDIQLPFLSGYQVIEKIKEINKDLPVLAQTAYVMTEDIEKSLNAGFNEHLGKPIKCDELRETINKYLNK